VRIQQRPERTDRVGVLVVSHRQEYLEECLRSILEQTLPPSDVVLVDNASPSGASASAVAARLGIAAVRLERSRSLATARNIGCEVLDDCALLASVDGDDLLLPRFLEVYVGEARDHRADVVFGSAELFGAETGVWFTAAQRGRHADLRRGNFIAANSVFRRELWRRVGGFDPRLDFFEDWDFWLSCAERGAVFRPVEETLWRYRRHPASMLGASDPSARDEARRYVRQKHLRYIWGPLQWRRWERNVRKHVFRSQ
jgi:glycosyltransferase involved in cell wall biosynthesis